MPRAESPIVRAESRIEKVTVFSDHAHVTRIVEAQVGAGIHILALEGLPRHVDPATIEATIDRGTLVAVELGLLPTSEGRSDDVDLDEAIDGLKERLHQLGGRAEALASELELIDAMAPDGERPSAALAPARFLEGLDVLMNRRRETLYQLRMADYERQQVLEQLDERRALRFKKSAPSKTLRDRTRVMLSVETDAEGPVRLAVTYAAGWATWRPLYDVRLTVGTTNVEITRYAEVWQETGEDWDEVVLAASTAVLDDGLTLPRTDPWLLEARPWRSPSGLGLFGPSDNSAVEPALLPPPIPKSNPRSNGAGRVGAAIEFIDDEAPTADLTISAETFARSPLSQPVFTAEPPPDQRAEEGIFSEVTALVHHQPDTGPTATEIVEAKRTGRVAREGTTNVGVVQTPSPHHPDWGRFEAEPPPRDTAAGFDFELVAPERSTLPSGPDHHRVAIGALRFPADVRYLLRPAAADHAFLRIVATNTGGAPLLAGNASVFRNERYVGTVRTPTAPPKAKVTLDLGAEPRIACSRRTRTTVRTEGLLTREDVHVVDVTIAIESTLQQPARIEVQDQVPISADTNVRVRLMKTEPRDAALDDITGVLTFDLTIGARGRADVLLSYEIETPKDYGLAEVFRQ